MDGDVAPRDVEREAPAFGRGSDPARGVLDTARAFDGELPDVEREGIERHPHVGEGAVEGERTGKDGAGRHVEPGRADLGVDLARPACREVAKEELAVGGEGDEVRPGRNFRDGDAARRRVVRHLGPAARELEGPRLGALRELPGADVERGGEAGERACVVDVDVHAPRDAGVEEAEDRERRALRGDIRRRGIDEARGEPRGGAAAFGVVGDFDLGEVLGTVEDLRPDGDPETVGAFRDVDAAARGLPDPARPCVFQRDRDVGRLDGLDPGEGAGEEEAVHESHGLARRGGAFAAEAAEADRDAAFRVPPQRQLRARELDDAGLELTAGKRGGREIGPDAVELRDGVAGAVTDRDVAELRLGPAVGAEAQLDPPDVEHGAGEAGVNGRLDPLGQSVGKPQGRAGERQRGDGGDRTHEDHPYDLQKPQPPAPPAAEPRRFGRVGGGF